MCCGLIVCVVVASWALAPLRAPRATRGAMRPMRSSFILLFATAIAVRLPLPKSPRARILKAELTEAWLEESKAGLVQMLRENHPRVEQSRAVFTMLAANAPPPTEGEWVSGDYVVRSSAIIADALESAGGDESKLLDGTPVSLSVSESGELALELSLTAVSTSARQVQSSSALYQTAGAFSQSPLTTWICKCRYAARVDRRLRRR